MLLKLRSGQVPPLVGVDAEWVAGAASLARAAGTARHCVLIRTLKLHEAECSLPPSLSTLLEEPTVFKLGVGVGHDLRLLWEHFGRPSRGGGELQAPHPARVSRARDCSVGSPLRYLDAPRQEPRAEMRELGGGDADCGPAAVRRHGCSRLALPALSALHANMPWQQPRRHERLGSVPRRRFAAATTPTRRLVRLCVVRAPCDCGSKERGSQHQSHRHSSHRHSHRHVAQSQPLPPPSPKPLHAMPRTSGTLATAAAGQQDRRGCHRPERRARCKRAASLDGSTARTLRRRRQRLGHRAAGLGR